MNVVFDAGVLGRLCNPNPAKAALTWIRIEQFHAMHPAASFFVPEIADFEVRRKLLHIGSQRALQYLDALVGRLTYLPLDTPTIRKAAELWAAARRMGQPTAGDHTLDADVILAAQALGIGGTVATTNVRHLSRYVPVEDWT